LFAVAWLQNYATNINVVEEMTNMMQASRGYEANVQTIQAAKRMFQKALLIGMG